MSKSTIVKRVTTLERGKRYEYPKCVLKSLLDQMFSAKDFLGNLLSSCFPPYLDKSIWSGEEKGIYIPGAVFRIPAEITQTSDEVQAAGCILDRLVSCFLPQNLSSSSPLKTAFSLPQVWASSNSFST